MLKRADEVKITSRENDPVLIAISNKIDEAAKQGRYFIITKELKEDYVQVFQEYGYFVEANEVGEIRIRWGNVDELSIIEPTPDSNIEVDEGEVYEDEVEEVIRKPKRSSIDLLSRFHRNNDNLPNNPTKSMYGV